LLQPSVTHSYRVAAAATALAQVAAMDRGPK